MSHEVDECYTSYEETFPRARKEHTCGACGDRIPGGHRYARVFIRESADGDCYTVKRCLRCQHIHEHLRMIDPGSQWPDEELDCGEEYESHWGVPPPDSIARLAFLTPDEAQRELAPGPLTK